MYGKDLNQGHKEKARRGERSHFGSPSHRFKQSSLYFAIRQCNKTALRHRYAIQHLQQRLFIVVLEVHEREKRLDFFGCFNQSKSAITGQAIDSSDSTGTKTKQSELVWHNLVLFGQYQWLRDKCQPVASWCLCQMATIRSGEQKKATTTRDKRKALQKAQASKRPIKTQLSVHRISRPCFISVHRIRDMLCLSVHRIYVSYFSSFPYPYIGHLLDIPLHTALIGVK